MTRGGNTMKDKLLASLAYRLIVMALFGWLAFGAVTSQWPGIAVMNQWGATAANHVDWVTDTMKMSLHLSTFVFNQDTHDFFDDATNELAGTGGYTVGGVTLAGKTLTYDSATNTVRFRANDVTWTALTASAAFRQAVIRKDTGVAATSPLFNVINFGADQQPGGIDFVVKGDATDGFARAVVS